MMRAVVLLGLLSSAAAFIPATFNTGKSSYARKNLVVASVSDLIGADTETGGIWDPLGLSQNEGSLRKYRECELKHGRVAMAAMLGIFVQGLYHLPDPVFSNPRPLAALQQVYEQRPEAIWQIIVGLGVIEFTGGRQKEDRAPGDLNFGSSFIPKSEKEFEELQLKELKNGRLAMVASMGALLQEYLTGQGPVEQVLAGHLNPFGDGQGFF
ncbi:light harvesting complex protein [Nannochloropsis gaditana]|nr:light harvesting complex protein [Nannochloropsis gaditana]